MPEMSPNTYEVPFAEAKREKASEEEKMEALSENFQRTFMAVDRETEAQIGKEINEKLVELQKILAEKLLDDSGRDKEKLEENL